MAVTNTLYTLNTYTVDTPTDLVPAAPNFTMASFLAVNTTAGAITVIANITDAAGTSLATLLSETSIPAHGSTTVSIKSLNIPATSFKLMVQANVAGVNFIASGVTIT